MTHPTNLLSALRSLDPQAISTVHEQYFPELFRYARYRLGDPRRAEDVASEVFLRLLEALHDGSGPRDNLHGWLMRTTANIVSDTYREQYRHPTEAIPEPLPDESPGPAAKRARAEQGESLRRAMIELTEEQQHVLALRFGSGLSLKETAQRMGKRVPAVKSLQYRAVAALREHLGGEPS